MKKHKQFQLNYKTKSYQEILSTTGNIRDVFYIAYSLIYPELKFGIKTDKNTIHITSNAQLLHAVENKIEAINKFLKEQLPNSVFIESIEIIEIIDLVKVDKYTIGYKSQIGSLIEFKGLTLEEATEYGLNQIHKDFEFSVCQKGKQLEARFNHSPDGDFSSLSFQANHVNINSWFKDNLESGWNTELKFVVITKEGEEE